MVHILDVKKRLCMSLDIGFTTVTGIREGHGCARISSEVIVNWLCWKWWEVCRTSAIGAFNDQVQWGEDLLTTRALLVERELEHAFIEIQ